MQLADAVIPLDLACSSPVARWRTDLRPKDRRPPSRCPMISQACATSVASPVDGHRRASTGRRAIAELPGALEPRGGGLFTGCAGGHTARAAVLGFDG
jgi:hypothetical protein